MAKQLVSPVERHLEKAVLGVAGLLLLGVIAKYFVTSPNHLEVGGETRTPRNIDDVAAIKARDVREQIRTARAPQVEFEPLFGDFVAELDPFAAAGVGGELRASVPIGPEVPIIDKAMPTAPERTLVDVAPFGKPVLTSGRSTLHLDPDDASGGQFRQSDWVTVSAVFNVWAQEKLQQETYGPKHGDVVFGPVRLQRRTQRHDGSWRDEDWESIAPWPAEDAGPPPLVEFEEEDGRTVVTRAAWSRLENYYEDLLEPAQQLALLRPFMPDIRDGTPWAFPVVTTYRDVLLMDHEYLFPNEAPDKDLEDRYGGPVETVEEVVKVETPQEKARRLLDEAKRYLALARKNCEEEDANRAYNRAQEVTMDVKMPRGDQSKARNLMELANDILADIGRGICRPQTGGRAKTKEAKSDRLATQQVWAHDARPGSIRSGRAYQYRLRQLIFNQLAGKPDKFADSADAQVVFIEGPWSEPSDPIVIEPATYLFATASDARPGKDNVTVEQYQWFEGVWVKDRSRFRAGDRLSHRRRCEVPSLSVEGEVERPMVAFDPGLLVVDIDHKRAHRARKRAGKGGVAFEEPSAACCIVWMDVDGRLHERCVPTDKSAPTKATVASKVYKPPRG